MPWYKRLRWRLIASQFVVALVGVAIMLLATRLIILATAPNVIGPPLRALIAEPALLESTVGTLLIAFRNAVIASVAVAAVGATAAGIVSSYILWRTLIAPLREVAESSRRVADGRYSERVAIPDNSGEAMAELVINFNEMASALAQVEQQRVTLLGNISHELRTPLAGLKGYLEGLQDGLFAGDDETYDWMLQEVNRLSRLVDDIQRLSRVEAGRISLNLERFALAELLQRVQIQMLPEATSREIRLEIVSPETDVCVYADQDRTAQVMLNLIGNALRYTPAGGCVTITLAGREREAQVAVRDTGGGIPAAAVPYLFERFYRVDQSRARNSGGSGIGLTISRHLVWAMGGEISASSDDGGSTFTFSLPLAE